MSDKQKKILFEHSIDENTNHSRHRTMNHQSFYFKEAHVSIQNNPTNRQFSNTIKCNSPPNTKANANTVLSRTFVHPWALTPKSKCIRVKSSNIDKHTVSILSQRDSNDYPNFLKTSIHCIHPNRRSISPPYTPLGSPCKYQYHRMKNMKWQKAKEQSVSSKMQQLRKIKKEQIQKSTEIKSKKQIEEIINRERLRQRILHQRVKKQKAYENVHKEKAFMALSQRVALHHLKTQKKSIEDFQQYQKKLLCQRQKQIENDKKVSNHRRKLQVRAKMSHRWVSEVQLDASSPKQSRHKAADRIERAINALSKSSLIFL